MGPVQGVGPLGEQLSSDPRLYLAEQHPRMRQIPLRRFAPEIKWILLNENRSKKN